MPSLLYYHVFSHNFCSYKYAVHHIIYSSTKMVFYVWAVHNIYHYLNSYLSSTEHFNHSFSCHSMLHSSTVSFKLLLFWLDAEQTTGGRIQKTIWSQQCRSQTCDYHVCFFCQVASIPTVEHFHIKSYTFTYLLKAA